MMRRIQSGSLTCEEMIFDCLERGRGSDMITSNAFLSRYPAEFHAPLETSKSSSYDNMLLSKAKESDARWKRGEALSPVDGMPIAIKDNFCVKGWRTTAGSRMLQNFVAPYDSAVSERLIQGGALLVGKTNMDEFGMGSFGTHSFYGPTIIPETGKVAGGSSSGSAAAVSLGACVAAIGSDTGGSVRLPAAFCGVTGFKPSRGRVSRWGLIAYASSLDTPGVIARDSDDVLAVIDVISGPDSRDATCMEEPWLISAQEDMDLNNIIVGIPNEMYVSELPLSSIKAWEFASNAFSNVISVNIPSVKWALPAYYIIATAEAASNLARYDGVQYGHRATCNDSTNLREEYTQTRSEGFGFEVQRRLLMGCHALSSEAYDSFYGNATALRRKLREEICRVLETVDVLLTPVTPFPALTLKELQATTGKRDSMDAYLSDFMTVPASLAGLPSIALPSGEPGQSIQMIAGHGKERKLLQIARSFQKRNVKRT